ncbi:MAG TPA: lytic transglycosylase domain-containing protein [Candidatus Limnocylindria bacterium]|nr:lytic transglycosylase domain-containing protein [Candidatus Limnocylindria bacterium]
MAERGIRRIRLLAALTIAGVTGLAGGTLPNVVANDDTPPIVSTDTTATQCTTTTTDAAAADQAVTGDPTTSTDQCAGDTPPPTTDTTETTPPPPPPTTQTTDAPPAADPATTVPTDVAPTSPPPAPGPSAPAKPNVTGHSEQHTATTVDKTVSTPAPQKQVHKRVIEHTGHTHGRKTEPKVHPLHPSPYSGLTMHWTIPDPLGLDNFPKITVDEFPVPPFLLPIYQAAGAQYRVHWQILAAINEVETDFGRNLRESSAGAIGWMQFLPSSWHRYGVDADGDGKRDPWDPVDAIFAAARYLHAAGAESSLPNAIFAYNHAGWYVDQVIDRARTFAGLPDDLVSVLTRQGFADTASIKDKLGKPSYLARDAKLRMPGQALLLDDHRLRHVVLHDDQIQMYGCGRADIVDNRIDDRVLATLEFLRLSKLDPTVTALECGHSFFTTSGNVSEHSSGDAVDIAAINGTPILGHQGPGSITDDVVRQLLDLQGLMDPHQIITLMTYAGHDNTLALPDHANHVHIGFRPMARDVTRRG